MTWPSLQTTLSTKARVLAGPVLRQVTAKTVTVWLALRTGATVTLIVQDPQGKAVMRGTQRSVAVGVNLHIVAVTANVQPPFADLSEGIVYRYDLSFAFDGNLSTNLGSATHDALLSYFDHKLPTFALPPQDVTRLRLIQGSCRKPHGHGPDALAIVDNLLIPTAGDPYARPHQLLLGGDQIYADDVVAVMLTMLTDASTALLGWSESLPAGPDRFTGPELAPFMRHNPLISAGFTSEDLDCHLMTLGEYLAMYLFVWSEELWPPAGSEPSTADIRAEMIIRMRALLGVDRLPPGVMPVEGDVEKGRAEVLMLRRSLQYVRRVLANVPSYMIFDDHEMTDDWNMTRKFTEEVYGDQLGQRVIQNGMVAYTLCQHWGNVPETFTPGTPATALINLIDTPNPAAAGAFQQKSATYDRNSAQIRSLLGLHDAATLKSVVTTGARPEYSVYHDDFSLRYDFTVEGPGHQVIFTDTRTWRSFPKDSDELTHLLAKNSKTDQFQQQILGTPELGNRQLMIVLTTNAPPVQPIRAGTRHDTIAKMLAPRSPDLYEAWDLPSVSFDRLLTAVTGKLPLNAAGVHTGSVVLLSGDVHHAFATRMIYRATHRYEDTSANPAASAVIAQLVASPFKNQTEDTIRFSKNGYFAAPAKILTHRLMRLVLTEGYIGWNLPPNSSADVGDYRIGQGNDAVDLRIPLGVSPTLHITKKESPMYLLRRAPEYRYRLDYLLPTAQSSTPGAPPPIPTIPSGPADPILRQLAAGAFAGAARQYQLLDKDGPPSVVGYNTVAEMTFQGSAANRKVNHIVRWAHPRTGTTMLTTYTVRLDVNAPNDTEFPDIKADHEP